MHAMLQPGRQLCNRFRRPFIASFMAICLGGFSTGCASITNPLGEGVPVRQLPPELMAPSKKHQQTIPLNVLQQQPPDKYRLDTGDVLGVYIKDILEVPNQQMPLHVGPRVVTPETRNLPPAAGYPVAVEEDGAIALPNGTTVRVRGLSIQEARSAIRNAVKKELTKTNLPNVIVTLLQPRHERVMVFRQEAASFNIGPQGVIPSSDRGTGHIVELSAYQNDVLHALAQTGGLPSLDAYNAIIIYRNAFPATMPPGAIPTPIHTFPWQQGMRAQLAPPGQVVRIPLRSAPGEFPGIRPEDVILRTGDVVFLEARDDEVFYTGGLLPPGKHVLPRDHDIDVLEAIAQVHGPFFNGAFGGNNLSGTLIQQGIGNPSPTLLTVLRRVPDGRQVPIIVDLRRAVKHPEERLVLQAGDILVLQEKPGESIARFFTQTMFNFEMVWEAVRGSNATGLVNIASPNRITDQIGNVNIVPR